MDRWNNRQDEIKNGIQSIAELSEQRMLRIEGYFKHLNQLTTSLDEKLSDASKQSSNDYQKLIQRMNTLSNQMSQLHQQKDHQLQKIMKQQDVLL